MTNSMGEKILLSTPVTYYPNWSNFGKIKATIDLTQTSVTIKPRDFGTDLVAIPLTKIVSYNDRLAPHISISTDTHTHRFGFGNKLLWKIAFADALGLAGLLYAPAVEKENQKSGFYDWAATFSNLQIERRTDTKTKKLFILLGIGAVAIIVLLILNPAPNTKDIEAPSPTIPTATIPQITIDTFPPITIEPQPSTNESN